MHPIEQLRFVARASGADAGLLVEEAASALSVFGREPAAMLTAARRLLTRQPSVGPLWWMCSHMVTAADPRSKARDLVAELRQDRTGRNLVDHLPDGATVAIVGWPDLTVAALPRRGDVRVLVLDAEGQGPAVVRRLDRQEIDAEDLDMAKMAGVVEEADVVVIEGGAIGSAGALVDVGSLPLAATARATGKPVWLVAGAGRRLPEPYWQAIIERTSEPDLPRFLASHEVVSLGLVDRVFTADGPVEVGSLPPPDTPLAPELLVELA